jgi:hypothetical protein
MSLVYRPCPVTNRLSSRRLTGLEIPWLLLALDMLISGFFDTSQSIRWMSGPDCRLKRAALYSFRFRLGIVFDISSRISCGNGPALRPHLERAIAGAACAHLAAKPASLPRYRLTDVGVAPRDSLDRRYRTQHHIGIGDEAAHGERHRGSGYCQA